MRKTLVYLRDLGPALCFTEIHRTSFERTNSLALLHHFQDAQSNIFKIAIPSRGGIKGKCRYPHSCLKFSPQGG